METSQPLTDGERRALADNLARVRERIGFAAERAGRDAAEVQLVAVTKSASVAQTQAIVALGVRALGESRVQAAQEKIPSIAGEPTWHMIGHLQRNKARKALELMQVIQSVDSVRLIETLQRLAAETDRTVPILIEANMSGEARKHGLAPADVAPALEAALGAPNLTVRGLMTMAPFTDDEATIRRCFAGLRDLRESLRSALGAALSDLSMGMTNDFELGIAEGATIVRIGSALFAP